MDFRIRNFLIKLNQLTEKESRGLAPFSVQDKAESPEKYGCLFYDDMRPEFFDEDAAQYPIVDSACTFAHRDVIPTWDDILSDICGCAVRVRAVIPAESELFITVRVEAQDGDVFVVKDGKLCIVQEDVPQSCTECKFGERYGCVGDVKCMVLEEYFTGNTEPPYKERPDKCPLVLFRNEGDCS